jgi:hypothetical protein
VVPSQLTQPAIDFSTIGGAFANEPPAIVPLPVVPLLPVVPPLVEPPAVEPPVAVVPPDALPPVVALPVVPPRLIAPDTLAVSELDPLHPQTASETLIAARRQSLRALNSIGNLITYSS